jgi:protein gp37
MWPSKYDQSAAKRICTNGGNAHPHYRDNAWIGTSISDQPTAETFIVELLQCRDLSPVLFLSAEPLLGPIDFAMRWKPPITSALSEGIDWVIIGGESGSGHRTCDLACITSLVNQCRNADVACFVKQDYGPRPGMQGRIPDDIWAVKQFPRVEVPS